MHKHTRPIWISLSLSVLLLIAAGADATGPLVRDSYPTLTAGALASASLAELPSTVVLQSGQIKITQRDLNNDIAKAPADIRAQLKRNLFFVLENRATQMLLEFEAADWASHNKTAANGPDDRVKSYVASLTSAVSVTDQELKAFFDANTDMMGGATFEQAKSELKDYVLNQKKQDAVRAHIASLGEEYDIVINRTWADKQNSAAIDNPVDKARMSGKPTMVDMGADGCRPCDMMAPILESLKKEYAGRANVLFVHVRKEQVLAARYGVESIPVQIFFDKDGKEVMRHVGFFPKEQIIAKLAELGAK